MRLRQQQNFANMSRLKLDGLFPRNAVRKQSLSIMFCSRHTLPCIWGVMLRIEIQSLWQFKNYAPCHTPNTSRQSCHCMKAFISPTLSYEIHEPEEVEDERMTEGSNPKPGSNLGKQCGNTVNDSAPKNYTSQSQGHATPTNQQLPSPLQEQQEHDPISDFLSQPEQKRQLPQPTNEQGTAFRQLQQSSKYNDFKMKVLNDADFQDTENTENIEDMIKVAFIFFDQYPNELANFAVALRILAQGPLLDLNSTHIRQVALANVAKGFTKKGGRRKFQLSHHSFAMALSTIPSIPKTRPLGIFYFLFRLFLGFTDTDLTIHYGTRIRGKCLSCHSDIDLLYPFVRADSKRVLSILTLTDIIANCTAGDIENPECPCRIPSPCTIFDPARQLTILLENNENADVTYQQVEHLFNTAPANFGGARYNMAAVLMKSAQTNVGYIIDRLHKPVQKNGFPLGIYNYIEGVTAADRKKAILKDPVQGLVLIALDSPNKIPVTTTPAESSKKLKRQLSCCPSVNQPPVEKQNITKPLAINSTPPTQKLDDDAMIVEEENDRAVPNWQEDAGQDTARPLQTNAPVISKTNQSSSSVTIPNPTHIPINTPLAEGAIAGGPPLRQPMPCTTLAEGKTALGTHNTSSSKLKVSTPHTSQIPYMLISLFDGCGSTFEIVRRRFGYAPAIFVAAEWDETLRHIVAEQLGLSLRENWSKTRHQATALYIKDVKALFHNDCKIVKELVQVAKSKNVLKILLIGGSPCTELTLAEGDKGLLGITGPNSVLFFTFHLLMYHMSQLLPQIEFRFLVENAGTMKDMHYDAICKTLGISLQVPRASRQWCASSLSLAKRKRFFFRNFQDQEDLQHAVLTKITFKEGWGPLLTVDLQEIPFEPFMRPRATLTDVSCRLSWSSYHPNSLVWHYTAFGGKAQFAAQAKITKGQTLPQLQWEKVIPSYFLHSWQNFLRKMIYGTSTKERDEAIEKVLPLFHNPAINVPFRILTLQVAGLDSFFDKVAITRHLLDEFTIRSLVGNSFHPSLIAAALGTQEQCLQWLQSPSIPWQLPSPTSVVNIFDQVVRQIQDVLSTSRRQNPKKQMQHTPYGKAPIQMMQTTLPRNMNIADLTLFKPLATHTKATLQTQLQEQRRQRLDRLIPGFEKLPSGIGFDFLFDNGYPASTLIQDITPSFFGCSTFPSPLSDCLHWVQRDTSLESACCFAFNIILSLSHLDKCGILITQPDNQKISPCLTPTAMLSSQAKTNGVSKLTEIYKVPSLELAWNLHLKPFAWNLGTSYNVCLEPLYIWNMGTFSWNHCLLGTFTENLWLGTLKPWNLMHP